MDAKPHIGSRRNRVLFIGAALLVLLGFEVGARMLGPNTNQVYSNLYAHGENLEVVEPTWLIVGDSSIGAAIDPAVFDESTGEQSYNLWQPTASMRVVERLVFEYGLRRSTPRAVVIGVTARMFNGATSDDVLATQIGVEQSQQWRRVAAPSAATDFEDLVGNYSALVRHRAALRRPSDWYRAATAYQPVAMDERGHLTFDESLSVTEIRPEHRDAEREALLGYVPGDDEFVALASTIERLHREGIAVYVVMIPVYDEIYSTYYPGGADDVAAFRSRLASELEEVPAVVIDLADFGQQDPSNFADENHLRPRAAQRFSTELGELVIAGSAAE